MLNGCVTTIHQSAQSMTPFSVIFVPSTQARESCWDEMDKQSLIWKETNLNHFTHTVRTLGNHQESTNAVIQPLYEKTTSAQKRNWIEQLHKKKSHINWPDMHSLCKHSPIHSFSSSTEQSDSKVALMGSYSSESIVQNNQVWSKSVNKPWINTFLLQNNSHGPAFKLHWVSSVCYSGCCCACIPFFVSFIVCTPIQWCPEVCVMDQTCIYTDVGAENEP